MAPSQRRATATKKSCAALLAAVLLLLAASSSSACAAPVASAPRRLGRRLSQINRSFAPQQQQQQPAVSAYASAPVSVNAAQTAPPLPALAATPAVKSAGKLLGLHGGLGGGAPPSTVVVLPTPAPLPVLAAPALPATTVLPAIDAGEFGGGQGISAGSLKVSTSSPVEVNSPVNVTTPVKQSSSQKGGKTVTVPLLGGLGATRKARGGGAVTGAIGALGAGVGLLNLLG